MGNNETKTTELEMSKIKRCPFCGGNAECKVADNNGSLDGYYSGFPAFRVECTKCGSSGELVAYTWFRDSFKEGVIEYRRNPSLRAKREDEYEDMQRKNMAKSIEKWNSRVD